MCFVYSIWIELRASLQKSRKSNVFSSFIVEVRSSLWKHHPHITMVSQSYFITSGFRQLAPIVNSKCIGFRPSGKRRLPWVWRDGLNPTQPNLSGRNEYMYTNTGWTMLPWWFTSRRCSALPHDAERLCPLLPLLLWALSDHESGVCMAERAQWGQRPHKLTLINWWISA